MQPHATHFYTTLTDVTWIKFPAADVMGPMCASAVLHLTGLTPGMPPGAILAAALCVSGAALGSQTKGVTLRSLGPVLGHTVAMFALFTALAVFAAFSLSALTGLEAEAVFLAFAPAGLTEMAAVSLAMSHDPAFVALHHALRVTVCAFIGSALARWSTGPED